MSKMFDILFHTLDELKFLKSILKSDIKAVSVVVILCSDAFLTING